MVHKYFPDVSMDPNVVIVDYSNFKMLHMCFIFSPNFTSHISHLLFFFLIFIYYLFIMFYFWLCWVFVSV